MKNRSVEEGSASRWQGALIFAALMLSVNSLFAAVTSISQLDSGCAFSFAAISDNRADTDQDCGRAFGWIQQYHDFVFEVGDMFDGNVTSNNTYEALWRNNTFRKNNTYPVFGNHCSKIDGGDQCRWGIPYFTLTNLNQTGWTFRAPGTETVRGYKNKTDLENNVYTYFPDRKIDYYLTRSIAGFKVHIISIYNADYGVFFYKSANFMRDRVTALVAAGKTKHDIIVLQGHVSRWLLQAQQRGFAGYGPSLTSNEVRTIAQNVDIVLCASDHRFRRVHEFDAWNIPNGALHVNTGMAAGDAAVNGYCEFHVFDGTDPKITCQYINSHVTTRLLHANRANNGAIDIFTDRGESTTLQYPMMKVVNGPITQPLNWSTFTINNGTTTVPWVTNLTVVAAGTAITNAGLVVGGVSQEYHATVPAGKIFSQTPGGNTSVARGSSVALAVSLGSQSSQVLTFTSVAAHDGYVDESSPTSNVGGTNMATSTSGSALRVGDTGGKRQRKAIVSFDTSALPDNAVITAAILKLKCGFITNAPASTLGTMAVDIKNTSTGFSNSLALQNGDFEAAASASSVGTLSNPSGVGSWSTASLNTNGTSRIATINHTQFRIRFTTDDDNDSADDYLGFYSGEAATAGDRPVLEVTYQ